jgi:hypothetical protein
VWGWPCGSFETVSKNVPAGQVVQRKLISVARTGCQFACVDQQHSRQSIREIA